MNPYYTTIAQRANHRCEYCKAPEVVFNFPFEVEHILLRQYLRMHKTQISHCGVCAARSTMTCVELPRQ